MKRNDFRYVDAIVEHSAGFAAAARLDLDARVEHCPEWSVADLVWHLTEVQWFWATIAEERLDAPADESRRPPRGTSVQLIEDFDAGASRLADVLRRTPYRDRVWTWAPQQQDVGFVARHQVQEAAVHHWDAANATGAPWSMSPAVAADCIDEFLTFSVSNEHYAKATAAPLGGSFGLKCSDTVDGWTVTDGTTERALAISDGIALGVATIVAPAADLLLWLYRRTSLDTAAADAGLLERFRDLTFTD